MSIQSRFFSFIFFLIGFFVVPLLVFGFFTMKKAETPQFYTDGLVKSDFMSHFIEDRLQTSKKVPDALKRNLKYAEKDVSQTVENFIYPQVESQIRQFIKYLKGGGRFPDFEFEMTLFKKNLVHDFNEAAKHQPLMDKVFIAAAIAYVNSMQYVFDLKKYVKTFRIQQWVDDNQKIISFFTKYRNFIPALTLVFLLFFLVSTFNWRRSLFLFSNLCLFSGIFFILVFAVILLSDLFLFQQLKPLLFRWFGFMNNQLPESVNANLAYYLLKTLSIQGLIASVCTAVAGIILYTKPKKSSAVPAPIQRYRGTGVEV
jgi:hypothetical protein